MINELKIFFDNVKKLRKPILNEGVSDGDVIDAINNREMVYLYYDSGKNIKETGYRIVVPFVLGKLENGSTVLRAWEINGNSASYNGRNRKPRLDHEYFQTEKGTIPGWRLFKTENIVRFLPTGEKFIKQNKNTGEWEYITPSIYNTHDQQMVSIIAAAPESGAITPKITGAGSVGEPDVSVSTEPEPAFDRQTGKFQQFYQQTTPTPVEIQRQYNLVKNVKHRSPNNYYLYRHGYGFGLVGSKQIEKMSQNQIVGNLKDLYNKYVVPTLSQDDGFFDQQKNMIKSELGKPNMEENNQKIKTFFKF